MELQDNPYLQQEDFTAGYKDSAEALKNNPELIAFDKVCYELFSINPMGKKFIEIIIERYLIPPLADRNSVNFETNAVWAEGFKDAFRMLRHAVLSHDQRIKAEVNKK